MSTNLSPSIAIKKYFSTPEKPVTMDEMKQLIKDRVAYDELALLCSKALGATLVSNNKK